MQVLTFPWILSKRQICPYQGHSMKVLYLADVEIGCYCPYCAEALAEKHRVGNGLNG